MSDKKMLGLLAMLCLVGNTIAAAAITDAFGVSYDIISVSASQSDGVWGAWDFCPYSAKATRFFSYFTPNTGSSAYNLECDTPFKYEITSSIGSFEDKTQRSINCAEGFSGITIRESSGIGIADAKFRCGAEDLEVPVPAGYNLVNATFGSLQTCETNFKICGIRSRISNSVGLTGLEFVCCSTSAIVDSTEETNKCDFEDGTMCDWETTSYFRQPVNSFDPGSTLKVFEVVSEIPFRSRGRSGPASAVVGDKFVYYESFVDFYTGATTPVISEIPRSLRSILYNGTAWKNPRIGFYYHAYGESLGELYFEVLDSNNNTVQRQLLFSQIRHKTTSTSEDVWRKIEFNIASHINGNSGQFKLQFRVDNTNNGATDKQSGDFAFDALNMTYTRFGDCSNPGCHENATCEAAASITSGFNCTCKPGYVGNGQNDVNGCVFVNPCDNDVVCLQNYTQNMCSVDHEGVHTCSCGDGFQLSPDNSTCVDIIECDITNYCGGNTTCTNTMGNFTCECMTGFSANPSNGRYNLDCDADGQWSEWSLPTAQTCSKSCGEGVYNASRTCDNPSRVLPYGQDCVGPEFNVTMCQLQECPSSCSIWKNCTCQNVTVMYEGGPLNMGLTFFNGLSSNDLEYSMTKLSQWNQTVVEQVCRDSFCDVAVLNDSIRQISMDVDKISGYVNATNMAKIEMRDYLDCNPANLTSHNEWLWDIFDKLCEYDAFLPNIRAELSIKMDLLVAERDRCANRSTMRRLIELMYRKW